MNRKLFTLFLLLLAGNVSAQEGSGIEGRISDARTGLPLSSARVVVAGTAGQTQTDAAGDFRLLPLSPGCYDLQISRMGYKPQTISGIAVTPGNVTRSDVRLQPDPLVLPEMTVSVQASARAGEYAGARVISQADIQAAKPRDLPDLLEKQGLISVVSDGSPGGRRSVTIRGSASDQVLVLLDGHPLNESADGVADLSRLSLAEVKQVEIYPQAPAMLGAQAIGGVINIITLKPGLNETRLQASAGQYGDRQGSLTLGRAISNRPAWPVLGVFEHRESDGRYRYQVVPDDGIDLFTRNVGQTLTRTGADYRRDLLSLKLDFPGPVEAAWRRTFLHRHNPDYLPLTTQPHESVTDDDRQEFTLEIKPGRAWYQPAVTGTVESYSQQTSTDYGPQYPLLNSFSNLRGEVYSVQSSWSAQPDWREISFGLGTHYERLWSNNLQGGYAGRVHEFGYVQVQGNPLESYGLPIRTAVFTGVRTDLYQGQNPFIHPNLGLELGGGEALVWSLRTQMAPAYHLPTFNALFWQEDLQSRGNPDLKPERSLNREISGKIGWKGMGLNVSWFDRQIWDMIYWRLDFDNKWKPLNLRRAHVYGVEIALNGHLGQGLGALDLNATHSWMRAIDRSGEPNTDGMLLPYRPENTTTLSLKENLKIAGADLTARWVSRRYTTEANTQWLSPYQVWDAGLTKTVNFTSSKTVLSLRAEVRNLFNRSYRIINDAPVPLREFWLSASLEQILN